MQQWTPFCLLGCAGCSSVQQAAVDCCMQFFALSGGNWIAQDVRIVQLWMQDEGVFLCGVLKENNWGVRLGGALVGL